MPYPFLSDEWIEAAHALREDLHGIAPGIEHPVRINLVVTEIPFGDGDLEVHMDSTAGDLEIDKGHFEDADLTITLDYDTAKAILVDRNSQAGMQAFMTGRIRIDGDISTLMALQATPSGERAEEIAERLRAITE